MLRILVNLGWHGKRHKIRNNKLLRFVNSKRGKEILNQLGI